jgi:O-antigen ligase
LERITSIKISKDKLLAVMFFLLLYFFNSKTGVELKFIVLFFFSAYFFLKRFKVYTDFLNMILPLIAIFIIALFSSVFYNPQFYDIIKDTLYLTKPIIAICFGCYFVQMFNNKRFILKALVLICFITSIIHILTIIIFLKGEWDTALIRYIGGKGSDFEAFIFSVFVVFLRKKEFDLFSKRFKRWFIVVVFISITLYLSRTTFIALAIFLISFYGFTQINKKQVIYLIGVFAFFVTFMVSLQFMDIDRQATGIESFFYKLQMAPSEIFDSEIDTSDHSQLWDGWRAYEAKKAFDTMGNEGSLLPYISGMGLGGLVDLGFEAPLGESDLQFIPHIHNGYVYVIFKSGVLGLLFLLFWLHSLYAGIYKSTPAYESIMFNRIISGLGMYLTFSTLVITGIYNMGYTLAILLGLMLGLKIKKESLLLKNKHI